MCAQSLIKKKKNKIKRFDFPNFYSLEKICVHGGLIAKNFSILGMSVSLCPVLGL